MTRHVIETHRSTRGVARVVSLGCLGLAWALLTTARADADDGSFGFTQPIACKEINGYERFVPLPDAALTSEDKLLVYFRPRHFKTIRKGNDYEAHFTEDARVRRRGEKVPLWSKKNLLDYTAKGTSPTLPVSLRNTIAIKGLRPGEYVLEIVLRDEVSRGAPAHGTLNFTIRAVDTIKPEAAPRVPGKSQGP